MIEWDGTGVELTEVVLMSDFDVNESAIFVGGLGSNAEKPRYRLVSKAVTYNGSYFTLLSALQTVSYNS